MTDTRRRAGFLVRRRTRILALAVVLAAMAVVLAVALGGGGGGSAAATASPAASPSSTSELGDLPLVTVAPTAVATGPGPSATNPPPASPGASALASPSAQASVGIPANRIRIARLGINLAVIEGDGIDAPIGKAAHYPGSAWPEAGSNIYIYGHARTGMFITLWQARVGDSIELDLVDGTSRTYVVTKVLPKVPWDAVQYLQPTKTEQLTVQTSTSYYPTAPRFIAIAVPAP